MICMLCRNLLKICNLTFGEAYLIFKSGLVDLDLDLTIFKKVGFGLDLGFFKTADLKIGLDLDLNIAGFTHHWLILASIADTDHHSLDCRVG